MELDIKDFLTNGHLAAHRHDSVDLSPTVSGYTDSTRDSIDLSPTVDGHIFPFPIKQRKPRLQRYETSKSFHIAL